MVAGETTSEAAQVIAHAINQQLGNAGKTVLYGEAVEVDPVDHLQSIADLARDMHAGQVDLLIMLDGVNPVYTAPVDLDFDKALEKVATRIHHGLYVDETAEAAIGTFPPRTPWRAGATPAPSTARRARPSRSSSRCSAARACTR